MNAVLNIEFLAGTELKHALSEAKELCINLGIAYVTFNFNGTEISVGKYADVQKSLQEWESRGGIKQKHYCFNHGDRV